MSAHREHVVRYKATAARRNFFTILEDVVSDPTAVVRIEHKSLPGDAVLVSETYLAYVRQLERLVRALMAPRPERFHLIGSVSAADDVDAAIAGMRVAERARTAAKFRDL